MILGVFIDGDGERQCNLYDRWVDYHKDTFCPDTQHILCMEFNKIKGKTYKEKKNFLRNLAVDYSNSMSEVFPISLRETIMIREWFEKQAKRFGLLEEFRTEAIC